MSRLSRIFAAAVLPACLLLARPAGAQQVVASVRSLDDLNASFKYLFTLIGQETQAAGFEQLRGALAIGIDPAKPITGFMELPSTPGAPPVVVVVFPMNGKAEFLQLLSVLKAEVKTGEGDIYDVATADGKRYSLKFVDKHAYVSTDRVRLTAQLPASDTLIPAEAGTSQIAVAVRLSQISEAYKNIARNGLDALVKAAGARNAGESEASHAGRQLGASSVKNLLSEIIDDGGDLTARIEVDRSQRQQVAWEISLSGKPGSKLAQRIKAFEDSRSVFTGLAEQAAASGLVRLPLGDDMRTVIGTFWNGIVQDALKADNNPQAQAMLKKLADGFAASVIGAPAIDTAVALRGPYADGKHALVSALALTDGGKLESALRDVLNEAKAFADVQLDADKVGTTAIHRVKPGDALDAAAQKVFGSNEVFVAVRKDCVVLAMGVNGKAALREALEVAGKPAPLIAPAVQLEASLAKLLPLFAGDKAGPLTAVFVGPDKHKDKLRITVRGGDALRIRAEVNAQVVKILPGLNGQQQ